MLKKFWRGNKQTEDYQRHADSTSPKSDESMGGAQGVAGETVAKILQILGRHAFDLDKGDAETFGKEFENWSRHVLLGTPTSDRSEAVEQSVNGRRNWGGLCQFVNRHRQQEKDYVVKGFHVLRDVIWTFTSTVSQAFTQDADTDVHMQSHIGRLRSAVSTKSPDELKREVLAAAEGLSQLLENRTQQQRTRMESLGSKLREVEEDLGQARKLMALDGLTQLYNRAALDEQVERVCALSVLSSSPACVMMVDIDHFKNVNDSYGHRAGDAVITELAKHIVLAFPRKVDFVARYGGEEFAIIVQSTSLENAKTMGDRLLSVVRQHCVLHENLELSVTVSIGMAEYIPGEPAGGWIERADQALYRAKQNGRNQMCVAGESQPVLVEV